MSTNYSDSPRSVHQRCEWDQLKTVILGTSEDRGGIPDISEAYDPTTLTTIEQGNFPSADELTSSFDQFVKVLKEYNVRILRPKNLHNTDQIFARDVGFTIDGRFVASSMIEDRQEEWKGIQESLGQIDVVFPPADVRVEGGDVLILPDALIIGFSETDEIQEYKTARTNRAALEWLKSEFPNREVVGVSLNKSDTDPTRNVLHLDCCLMPLGQGHYIIYKDGFKSEEDVQSVMRIVGDSDYMELTQEEMMSLQSNLLSLDSSTILSDARFKRVNEWLRSRSYKVHEIDMEPIGRLGGLFRCSTLPLIRENSIDHA